MSTHKNFIPIHKGDEEDIMINDEYSPPNYPL
jgi:hypothetical protein